MNTVLLEPNHFDAIGKVLLDTLDVSHSLIRKMAYHSLQKNRKIIIINTNVIISARDREAHVKLQLNCPLSFMYISLYFDGISIIQSNRTRARK